MPIPVPAVKSLSVTVKSTLGTPKPAPFAMVRLPPIVLPEIVKLSISETNPGMTTVSSLM